MLIKKISGIRTFGKSRTENEVKMEGLACPEPQQKGSVEDVEGAERHQEKLGTLVGRAAGCACTFPSSGFLLRVAR